MWVKNKTCLGFVSLVIVIACIAGTGCTSSQSSPGAVPGTPSLTPTTVSSIGQTVKPVTSEISLIPTTVPTAAITTMTTQKNDILAVTVNSAAKQTKIGLNSVPSTGNVFLILDVTLQNNDKSNDFEYSDSSFVIIDKKNQKQHSAITSKIKSGLDAPLSNGKVIMKSKQSGQIVFGVLQGSANNYKLNIVDSTGTVLSSVDEIHPN